ncbi:TetR/AcrR family transcriptional regulator C-terminal domain-containing protein [Occallatibacter riparius]|uniref:TetR/AcrR family transcriptional regulator C-terminal domain-containing protein n=1 Tax=Occallatibacter riparius TaxID=1002689 RepID=A0A9J7BNA4_9BACT|nr:TetR/AcrR family transcriptional regulator C-terminal domain-containing protein [Occallatibacter riparius]UWZ84372.1 TetR/AcrR family transcriptional regulator C-terminal domain-containing protein [Occallatibacter riparius]
MENDTANNEARTEIIAKVAFVLRQERATATYIESAVGKAGIDRELIIAVFGSMHGLILEMISELTDVLVRPLHRSQIHQTLRDVLIEFGGCVVDTHSTSHLVALYRIALTEATRHSGIGRKFFERGPGRLTTCLAQYLERISAEFNRCQIDNSMRLADAFLSLLGDNLELFNERASAGKGCVQNQDDAVIEAVDLFCRGILAEAQ